jgi:hypothetical protein
MNVRRNNYQTRIVPEQIEFAEQQHKQDLVAALWLNQFNQCHATDNVTAMISCKR